MSIGSCHKYENSVFYTISRIFLRTFLTTHLGSNWGHPTLKNLLIQKEKTELYQFGFMVAGVGLEPHDLRVMSPTSYQLLYPAIYENWHGAGDRDRTGTVLPPRDFKSLASACSATPADWMAVCSALTTCIL